MLLLTVLNHFGQLGRVASWRGSVTNLGRWLALSFCAAVLLLGGAGPAQAASACPSPVSITVPSGGNFYKLYLDGDCSPFGLTGNRVQPSHGTLSDTMTFNAVDYTNNGDGALSDTFTFGDDSGHDIVYNVTVLPATSPITLSPATVPSPLIGSPYSQSLSATGGVAPYTYALDSGSLPAGISLSSSGVISGTPTASGAFTFAVKVTDSTGPTALTATKSYSVTVPYPTLTISPMTLPTGALATLYSQQLNTTGGSAPYTYTIQVISGKVLPPGLSLSPTGVVSGTPTATGTYVFSVKVEDSTQGGGPGRNAYDVTLQITAVPAPAITSLVPNSGPMTGGTPVVIKGSGFTGATAVRFGASNASSFAINSATQITATSPAGSGTVDVRVTTAGGTSATSAADQFTYGAAPPIAGAYSTTVAYGSSATPITLNLSGGAATSVAVASAAAHGTATASGTSISYTPTAGYAGPDSFTYTATNAAGTSSPATVTLTVGPTPTITIAPATVSGATVSAAYSQAISAANGMAPYTYTISAGALPAGVSLNTANGILSGTPTAGGTFNFTVMATDSSTGTGPFSGAKAYTLTVAAPFIAVTPTVLTAPTQGVLYSQTITASGGTAPYSYAITGGAVPGLSLAADGTLSGTPTTAGAYSLTVTATDSSTGSGAPYTGSRAYSVTVAAGAPGAGTVSTTVAYGSAANPITLNLSGGAATSVAVASAAAHGTATASGTSISYTPTAGYAGPDSFTYTATNAVGTSAVATINVTVSPPTLLITPSASWSATGGQAYSQTLTWSGGAAPYTIHNVTGLPAGLSVTATTGNSLTISGTPTAAGNFAVAASATDSSTGTGPFTKQQTFTLTVAAPTLSLMPAGSTLTSVYGSAFSQTFSASGGVAPYTYALSGSLPTGLSWNAATATLSGTATQSGDFPITVKATDHSTGASAPFSVTNNYTLSVVAPTISLVPASVPAGAIGVPYSALISASGGIAPYAYTVSAGALPTGMALNAATGALSGTPSAAGSFNFTARASDANGFTGTRAYTIAVGAPTLTLTPAALPAAAVAVAYSATFSTSGGTAPYTYAVTAGSLPSGISLNSATGVLSGTTVQAGSFPITVRATDSSTGGGAPFSVQTSYTLVVAAPTISLAPSTVPGGTVAASYSATLSASGGAAPYAYSISAGALPAGVTLNASTGAFSGTPSAAGTFSFTVRALDANNFSGSQAYSLVIAAASVSLTPATLPNPTADAAYTSTLTAAGGTAPYAYSVIGALPSGLALNAGTGVLSGTATQSGSFPFSIRATDSSTGTGAPFSATNSYTLNVSAPVITVTPATVAAGKVNVAYSQPFAANGGTAPYGYAIAAGSLPAGLSLNTATGLLSGTPGAAGTFAFTVRATDAHSFTGQQALSLSVDQAQPVAVNDSATTAANQAVTVPVTANDSGPITSIAMGTPPTHGSAVVNGLNVVYTPASNYFGSDTLQYTATGPGGTSAPATVTVTVAALAVPVAVPQTATVLAGQAVTLHAANGASGGPFTAVAITSPPSAGAVVVTGTDMVYTSVAGSSGDIRFSYTLANAFGASAPVTATISVNPLPMAGAHSATVSSGAAVNIDLMAGATGGPFNAASVVAVAPTAAGTAVIRDVGKAGSPSYQMTFTAANTFAGSAVVSYTLRNAFATSAPGQVTITVAARPDMSTDAEVTGLLAAQADSAKRFASAQISNFSRRLESLHGEGWGRSDFGISFSTLTGQSASEAARRKNGEADRLVDSPVQPHLRKVGWEPRRGAGTSAPGQKQSQDGGITMAAADNAAAGSQLPNLPEPRDDAKQALSLWVGGALNYGRQDAQDPQAGYKFTTQGLSVGGDYRIHDLATVGIGAGFGSDSSTIGSHGTKSSANSTVAVVYGSLRPAKDAFIDGVLGYGRLSYDTTRYITDGGGFATGVRDGSQVFGSVVTGVEFRSESWLWSPYGRLEMSSTTLDPYTETAADLKALTYFKQTVRSTNGILGVRAEGRYSTGMGMLMPRVRVEFNHRFDGADEASLAYADMGVGGPVYIVRSNGRDTGNWTAGLGAKLVLRNGVALSLDLNTSINMNSGRSQSVMFGVAAPF